MSSFGPYKARDARTRASKPYERPQGQSKGLIRRVADSVTGLFSSSWLSSWLQNDEEGESIEDYKGLPEFSEKGEMSSVIPDGESFIFAQTLEGRVSYNIYPEEGEVEESASSTAKNRSATISDESNIHFGGNQISASLSVPGPSGLGRPNPTPFLKSTDSSHPLPLLKGDNVSDDDMSEGSSLVPRVEDEHEYQREILQLDDESLQTLRDSLERSQPNSSLQQSYSLVYMNDDLSKSCEAKNSVDIEKSSTHTEKSNIESPSDRSVLSDETFRSSPFYPGKTMYGGAASCKKVKISAKKKNSHLSAAEDGGLSQAAKRILDCLEKMSTPLSDAKRIPNPNSQLSKSGFSFLDSSKAYTAAFHKHKPNLKSAEVCPPVQRLITPVQVEQTENLSLKRRDGVPFVFTGSCDVQKKKDATNSPCSLQQTVTCTLEAQSTSPSVESIPIMPMPSTKANFSSCKYFQAKVADSKGLEMDNRSAAGGKLRTKVSETSRKSSICIEEKSSVSLPSISLPLKTLPKIDITMFAPVSKAVDTSLASQYTFATPEIVVSDIGISPPRNSLHFSFSSPLDAKIKVSSHIPKNSSICTSTAANINTQPVSTHLNSVVSTGSIEDVFKKSSSSLSYSKSNWGELYKLSKDMWECSVCLLHNQASHNSCVACLAAKPTSKVPYTSAATMSTCTIVVTSPKCDFPEDLLAKPNEWECSICLLRNKDAADKCIACENVRNVPLLDFKFPSKNSKVPFPKPFGSAFLKSNNEWECSVCAVRNKLTDSRCIACQGERPCGSELQSKVQLNNGDWECDMCLVKNKVDSSQCISCKTSKPGTVKMSEAITGSFKFGVNSSKSELPSFKFGSNGNAENVSSFKFGINNQKSSDTSMPGFKFDKVSNSSTAQGAFKFGLQSSDWKGFNTSLPSVQDDGNVVSKEEKSDFKSSFGIKPSEPKSETNAPSKLIFNEQNKATFKNCTNLKITNSAVNLQPPSFKATPGTVSEIFKAPACGVIKNSNTMHSGSALWSSEASDEKAALQNVPVSTSPFTCKSKMSPFAEILVNTNEIKTTSSNVTPAVNGPFSHSKPSFPTAVSSSTLFRFGSNAPSISSSSIFKSPAVAQETALEPSSFAGKEFSRWLPPPSEESSFGNITGFVFGNSQQMQEKKPAVGFNFGQASNVPSFNFGSSQQSPGIYQFGQSSSSNTSGNIFQLDSSPQLSSMKSSPSFGTSDKVFTSAPHMAGRTVKRAARRLKK